MLVEQGLGRVGGKDEIVSETLWGFTAVGGLGPVEMDGVVLGVDFDDGLAAWIRRGVPLSFYFWFMGLQRTITLTASAMCGLLIRMLYILCYEGKDNEIYICGCVCVYNGL